MSVAESPASIDLFWIPLGADGTGFVRFNGRVYEGLKALTEGRPPLALAHTALEVHIPEGSFVVETMWPCPDHDTESRGVVITGPVGLRASRWRTFTYEVRCWRDGMLPDRDAAVGGPHTVSRDLDVATRLIETAPTVPRLTWGRDEAGTGEMWNSNSVISWLLARTGLPVDLIHPPRGYRAPGWSAGVAIANGGTYPRS